ncbi:DUF6049 family protein [Streptosporangium carneum]|uniref:Glycoprotein n=1 Tax=Streptosporangium carneum TaxID=47481 RepID=A0A9W6MAD3_9ACTN|nr:DUF6049 family protein [Streptosporangium carneum]GLK06926.1 hypothetical protein GCM10017600_03310 [Streptosporangium carneum]
MSYKVTMLAVLTATLLSPAAVALPGTANAQTNAGASTRTGAESSVARQSPQLVLEAMTPDVPREPTTEIRISGSFVNTGTQTVSGMRVRMHYSSQPFLRRADMEAYAGGQGLQPGAWRDERYLQPGTLAPAAKAPWEFVFTPQQRGISRFGVYPIMIEVIDAFGQQVAVQRTFVVYMPRGMKVPRTRLAMVMPIVDQPRRAVDEVFLDDTLPASMASGKRLDDLLRIAKDTSAAKNLTWVVDPALLDDARTLGAPYSVKVKDKIEKRSADASAAKWLADLRAALADSPVVATPYADPDVAALAHSGVDDSTGTAIEAAKRTGHETLGRDTLTTVNWPANGMIDYDGLDLLSKGGVDTVLLNEANLPLVTPSATTPDASTTLNSVNGPVTALVTDRALSETLDTDTSVAGAAVLNRQRFVAETAMIASEPGAVPRTVIAAPQRRWSPDPAYVTGLVKTASTLPWLAPATLDSVKRGKGVAPQRADLTYTDQNRREELAKPYMKSVRRVGRKADLTAAVTDAQDIDVFDLALLRLSSSAWRGRGDAAAPYVTQVGTAVDGRIRQVSITGNEQSPLRTLAGTNGEVPISVRNGLAGPGSRVSVRLKVTSERPRLLKIENYKDELTIMGGQNQTVRVPMTVLASGQTKVKVQLMTGDGRRYGTPVELTVRTTGYTGIALVIVGAAIVVLLAAVVLRILRRRGTRRVAAPAAPRRASAPAGNES